MPVTTDAREINPFELFPLAVCPALGALVLSGVADATSAQIALGPLYMMWGGFFLVGGLMALAAPIRGGSIAYRIGLALVDIACLSYGLALLDLGSVGIVAGMSNIAFAFACKVRIFQVGARISAARTGVRVSTWRPVRNAAITLTLIGVAAGLLPQLIGG